ncbi:MAG: NIPSNAP family protein [Rhizobiaceae bacterium]|nr:NIPSNAP family protein [Rhizobiaceae bacterium]
MSCLCSIIELRQYTMVPGRRDDFVRIFDAEFIESQEALGIAVIGQFRDLDRDDRYVWMRGFRDMETRRAALTSFYEGPVWAVHRDAANATMTEWHDVLLLRPQWPAGGFACNVGPRPMAGAMLSGSVIGVTVVPVARDRAAQAASGFETALAPLAAAAGAEPLAAFVTETASNTYPRLPIREEASVLVWFTRFADRDVERARAERLAADANWRSAWREAFGCEPGDARTLRLSPTARSLLR